MPHVLDKSRGKLALAELEIPALLDPCERKGLMWILHRLRSTEPREIASRVGDGVRYLALAIGRHTKRPVTVKCEQNVGLRVTVPVLRTLEGIDNGRRMNIISQANKWLSHRAGFFGLSGAPLGNPIDWHRDYSSGMSGPKKYSALINHRESVRVGDVKYIWELNRHQHFVALALASAWTGADVYNRELEEQTRSWREQNPFMTGLNWKSPLEAGLRLISWAFVLFVQGHLGRVDTFQKQLLETVYQHQYFIAKFYSKHSSANNHLIGEMTGLYVACVFWPFFSETRSWRAFARQKLIQEIMRQVEQDGVGRERATEYQMFILELFILAGALGRAVGDDFPSEYWDRIGRMAEFLSAISDRNGNVPMFGDGDSGQIMSLPQTSQERVLSLLRVCRHGKQKHAPDTTDLQSRLLLWGGESEGIPLPAEYEPGSELRKFPQGGYYVLASNSGADDEVIVVFDAGPLGLAPLYAHGHADALSFWLSYGGREFLIDPGTFTYYTHHEWREYFRSTAAHNTVRIDGFDQSLSGGRFLWRHVAGCYLEYAESTDSEVRVKAFHDGYRRLANPVIHRRELHLDKANRKLMVKDSLECQGSHEVEIFFHFSEDCQVRQAAPELFRALNGDRSVDLRLDARFHPALYRGSEKPISGWISRRFGVKLPSFTVVGRVRIGGSNCFVSEVIPA